MCLQKVDGVRERVFLHGLCVMSCQNLAIRRERKVHASAGVLLLAAKDLYSALPDQIVENVEMSVVLKCFRLLSSEEVLKITVTSDSRAIWYIDKGISNHTGTCQALH